MSIESDAQIGPPLFINVRKPASNWNSFPDPQDIADTDAPDVLNMVFDRGYATPRTGSVLAWTKPSGETNSLINLFNAMTSDRKQYAMAIYGPNVYVRDEVNNDWLLLNGTYVPASPTLIYGYENWNAGVGSDSVYFGNGTDDTLKWKMSLDHTTVNQGAFDTSITLSSVAQFDPAGGVIVIKQPNLPAFNVTYSSITNTTLNLTTSLGQAVGIGAAVSTTIKDMSTMPKGKIFAKFQGRLFIGNSKGSETTMYYSNVGTPEDFTVAGTPSGGGFYGFIQGDGEITGIFDFGLYLGVLKGDSMQRFEFVIDATNTTKIDQVTPLLSDDAMGCPYFNGWVKKNNILYYPSATAGIFSISPVVTGFQTTIQLAVLSQNIQNYYQALNFATTRSIAFQTKVLWSSATAVANDTILVYDTLKQYWTKFNGWSVADWLGHNNNLYFGSYQDGNIYQALVPKTYTDNGNPYTSYTYTKRYDHGNGSMPKTETKLFVQGYILQSTNLYCDVMFNEQGTQQVTTYKISGNQPYSVQPISKAMGMIMMGLPIMGASDTMDSITGVLGVFKVYIPIPIRYGFYNIQFKFYSTDAASQWSVTGIGMNPRIEFKAPENLVINTNGTVALLGK